LPVLVCASININSIAKLTMTNSSYLNRELNLSEKSSEHDIDSDDGKAHAESKDMLDQTLAKGETRAVNCLRLVTFLILVSAAILVSVAVYLIMKHDEENTFEDQFNDLAFRLGTYPDPDFARL
jgi:hypothetical protein